MRVILVCFSFLLMPAWLAGAEKPASQREFVFHYRFEARDLPPGKTVRLWMPVPRSSAFQTVTHLPTTLPAKPTFHTEKKYGNRVMYLEFPVPESGKFQVDVPWKISRKEVTSGNQRLDKTKVIPAFSQPNQLVPIEGKPLKLLSPITLAERQEDQARQIYDAVNQHVSYDKRGTDWGHGDVKWVCDSRHGNCTDFHSLFISLARSQGIPARFEIGFSIPTNAKRGAIGGYHCWAFFHTKPRGWQPVDISEADKHPDLTAYYFGNLTQDRVTFTTGRDLVLTPAQAAGPLNFFIYPHLEIENLQIEQQKIFLDFGFSTPASETKEN